MNTRYRLRLETGRELVFDVPDHSGVEPVSLNDAGMVPEWVNLTCQQCSICPLDSSEVFYCPAAFDLQDVIEQCSELISYDRVKVARETDSGTTTTETDLQTALFSVIGERAISSACTVLNSRRWSLDYYSMNTSMENIFYRSLSAYLVKQFLLADSGHASDLTLKDHVAFVEETGIVFNSLLERFRYLVREDASNNAVVRIIFMVQDFSGCRDQWIEDLKTKVGI
jgi:hypothetical protein